MIKSCQKDAVNHAVAVSNVSIAAVFADGVGSVARRRNVDVE